MDVKRENNGQFGQNVNLARLIFHDLLISGCVGLGRNSHY